MSAQTVAGVAPGTTITVLNGTQPGNFGWLTWTGDPSNPALVTSLTVPGNSDSYVDPNNPSNHTVSVDDFVDGSPGVGNSSGVRNALTNLEGVTISVPVWNLTGGQGSATQYLISGFAQIQIQSFELSGQNRITATFEGMITCGNPTPTASPTVAPISIGFVVTPGAAATFATNNGQVQVAIPSNFWPTPTNGAPENVTLELIPTPIGGARTSINGGTPLLVLQIDITVNGTPTSGIAFAHPITVTMNYDPAQVVAAGLNPENLQIYLLSSDGKTVTALPSVVDEVRHTVTAQIPHLTQVILAAPRSVLFLPVGYDNTSIPGW